MKIDERRKEVIEGKAALFVFLISIIFGIIYFEYDYSNNLYNGIILLFTSIIFFTILSSKKFYIETGIRKINEASPGQFKMFCYKHPYITLKNKISAICLVIFSLISLVLIFISFFQ